MASSERKNHDIILTVTISSVFLILSFIQGFISQGIGIASILRGQYKPQRMTRFLWFMLNALILASLFMQGSREALYLSLAQNLGGIIILVLSFKFGMGGKTPLDLITLSGLKKPGDSQKLRIGNFTCPMFLRVDLACSRLQVLRRKT